jgi:hypothetical protein
MRSPKRRTSIPDWRIWFPNAGDRGGFRNVGLLFRIDGSDSIMIETEGDHLRNFGLSSWLMWLIAWEDVSTFSTMMYCSPQKCIRCVVDKNVTAHCFNREPLLDASLCILHRALKQAGSDRGNSVTCNGTIWNFRQRVATDVFVVSIGNSPLLLCRC